MRTLSLPLLLLAAAPAAAQDAPLAIRNAVVETMAAPGRLEKATVVIRGGKIAAVGKDVAIPEDARVIDAQGGTLMPGIIDPHFEVSIAAPTADSGPRTMVVRGRVVQLPGGAAPTRAAFTRIADNFYPYDRGFRPLPRAGLTDLNMVTTGTGQSAGVRLLPAEPERMLDRPNGPAFASVTNSSDSLDAVRTRLAAAERGRTGGGAAPAGGGGRPGGGGFGAGGFGGAADPVSTQLWQDVHDGKVPLICSVANAATVVHLMKAVEPYKDVNLVLFAPGDAAHEAIDSLKGRKVRVILRPGFDLVPNTRDRFSAARALHENGVEFGFTLTARPPRATATPGLPDLDPADQSPDSGVANQEFPLFPVAMLVKSGLPRQAALEGLTRRPAAMLGLEASHGSIEPGKVANLALYSGDPLDPASRLRLTLTDGRTAYED
jgi:hypothetical protein